ncbi:hypothetical protein EVAR_70456_1 [Eumeta japonica]|uniref:Uncharacterized protein n=1 Tax=Eumeta variegata TaxID=151549 RepID=A0A4C2AFB6_EUMVA|nr:hypothetical protein EVAR_70456_1 [Eumeta japonica]
MNLEKSIVVLKEQLELQEQLLTIKENEIEKIQQHYTKKIQNEEDLDQVHELSLKYQDEINNKTLEAINLKQRLQEMQNEFDEMKSLQMQNELQQKQIDQLNSLVEEYRLEIQELKALELHRNKQNEELHTTIDRLIKSKDKTTVEQEKELLTLKNSLVSTQHRYEQVQELYKNTKFQLELLEVEQEKAKFKNESDNKEIENLRNKLEKYLEETATLSSKIQTLEIELHRTYKENSKLKNDNTEMLRLIKDFQHNVEEGEANQMQKICKEMKIQNTKLKIQLNQEQVNKTDLNRMLEQEANEIKEIIQSLEDCKCKEHLPKPSYAM